MTTEAAELVERLRASDWGMGLGREAAALITEQAEEIEKLRSEVRLDSEECKFYEAVATNARQANQELRERAERAEQDRRIQCAALIATTEEYKQRAERAERENELNAEAYCSTEMELTKVRDALEQAQAEIARLREALEWYADWENWLRDKLDEIPALEEHGARARAALSEE